MLQSRARRWAQKTLGSLGLLSSLLLVLTSTAGAATFQAVVTSNGSFSTSTVQLEATTAGSVNCYSTGTGSGGSVTSSNTQQCASGSPVPTGELSNTASSTATTTLTSVGNLNATSSTTASSSCGVAELADAESATDWTGSGPDTALAFGGITYQAAGPLSGQAITTDGSSGWAETTTEYTNPESFTVLEWFKTSAAQGAITGFSNSQDPLATAPNANDWDRLLWVDPSGKLVWGIYDGVRDEITSASAVDTGSWVFAAVSVGAAGTALYVNNLPAVTSGAVTAAKNYSGWWTLGYGHLTSWADIPASDYFSGSVAQLAIVPSQLNAIQVSTIYGESSPASYAAAISTFSPANYWPMTDSGSVAFEGTIPGGTASTALVDASGNADTGTAEGGTTLGATGPSALGTSSAISLNGTTGYVETAKSYANPESFSALGWFKTSGATGGTVLGFDNVQATGAPAEEDRLLWVDNSGKVVFGVNNGTATEVTSPSAYNNGVWHMVVAEIGSSGEQLFVDGAQVALNASVTSAESYTGYWHIGWGYETGWSDAPTSKYLSGSLSEAGVVPVQLSAQQISALYSAGSTAAYALDMGQLPPSSYWPLEDSASNICGTSETTVQETVGPTNTCIYPPEPVGTACPALSATYMVTGLGTRTSTVVTTSGSPVTITVKMELSAASGNRVKALHMLTGLSFDTRYSSTLWSAAVSYPCASVEL